MKREEMRKKLLSKIRKLQVLFSITVFVLVGIMCYSVTGFHLSDIQLSIWGESKVVGKAWNSVIIFMSFTILSNAIFWIHRHPRLKYKTLLYGLFTFLSINLFIVGFFPYEYGLLHNVPAILYFFSYPLIIFFMVFINRSSILYSQWVKHSIISLSMITIPLAFITFFKGMGISEILHTAIVGIWNIILLREHKK